MRAVALASLALPLVFAACAGQPATATDAPTEITIEQGACYGFCPVYEMRLLPGDRYALDGRRFARTEGRTEGALSPGAFEAAARALDEADFRSLPADITGGNSDLCQPYMSDLPTFRITAVYAGSPVSVAYNKGCNHAGLNRLIDALYEAMSFKTLVQRPQ